MENNYIYDEIKPLPRPDKKVYFTVENCMIDIDRLKAFRFTEKLYPELKKINSLEEC